MDIGVMIAATAQTGDIATIAREVENLGYESFFIPEHPVIPIGFKTVPPGGGQLPEHYGRWLDPFVALTVAAAVTKRIKLGTGICLLPEREPLMTAKVIASLDVVSGGRVVLGVGGGWLKEETEAMGTQFGMRWRRLRETVEALRQSDAIPSRYRRADPRLCSVRMDRRGASGLYALTTDGAPSLASRKPSNAMSPTCGDSPPNEDATPPRCKSPRLLRRTTTGLRPTSSNSIRKPAPTGSCFSRNVMRSRAPTARRSTSSAGSRQRLTARSIYRRFNS